MQTRLFTENKLVVATHNQGKLREIRALLADQGVTVLSAGELGLDEPEETEDSFVGNARLKARAASKASGFVALADDSGLVVDALGGGARYLFRALGRARKRLHHCHAEG